jgi:hypothetical protein
MPRTENVLQRLGSEYTHGYGPAAIPSAIGDEVAEVIASLVASDAAGRRAIMRQMTEVHGFVLIAFAERMASRAVRENEPDFIAKGLSALAIAAGLVYIKEALPVVSLLLRSIDKLGLDARSVFRRASGFGNNELDRFLEEFPHRSKEDRSIEAMGYVEAEDLDGFRYKRTW